MPLSLNFPCDRISWVLSQKSHAKVPYGTGFAFREYKSFKDFPGISSILAVFQFLLARPDYHMSVPA